MKLISVVGARPQFIKLAPLSRRLRQCYNEVIVHTGQHYDVNMSDSIFRDLEIPVPDYNLGVGSGSHGRQTGKSLMGLEEIYQREKPQLVIVFGDTNATIAGALGAAKLNIPVAHVEAGLRSFNKSMPEEINRILTDHCSDLLFAPTQTAMQNLKNEALADKAFLTGDIMFDALLSALEIARERSEILKTLELQQNDYVLLTLHRPYNVDHQETLSNTLNCFAQTSRQIVFPVHPRTRKMLQSFNVKLPGNIHLVDPVSYLDFVWLEKNAFKIVTDSGGVQKEAFMLKVPCVTVRPETEWLETLTGGWNVLLDPARESLVDAVENGGIPDRQSAVFGKGDSAAQMVNLIADFLEKC